MIKVLIGNILDSKMQTLVNTVNCVGIMGKGIAQRFKDAYPDMYKDYLSKCRRKTIKPGEPYIYSELSGTSIINFPTKDHWRSPSRIEYIIQGLDLILLKYKDWGIESIAFPPLGCGNGGLMWEAVGPIMYQKLLELDIPVELYAPMGIPNSQQNLEFLSKKTPISKNEVNQYLKKKITPEHLTILEVLFRLENLRHAPKVGRTIFQHLCYVLTEHGVKTGFTFYHNDYGPFSQDVKEIITLFANSNLIQEIKFGKMIEITSGVEYSNFREKYKEKIHVYDAQIEKAVDLYCRIKNTSQSEEVTSVFYTIKQIKRNNPNIILKEEDVFNQIFQWKKDWNSAEKKSTVAAAIRNLVLLNWVELEYSDVLPILKIAV